MPSITSHYTNQTYLFNSYTNSLKDLAGNLQDRLQFLIEFIKDPLAIGSIVPSSPQLSKKIVQYIPEKTEDGEPKYYLEIGPGIGSFTKDIADRLRSIDHLDVVELNSSYCETLKKKFIHYNNVHIHCLSITDWHPDYKYDVVVSGLPLNSFPVDLVKKCIAVYERVTKEGGIVSYFEYPNISYLCQKFYYGQNKERLEKILALKSDFFAKYGFKCETVTDNFPTADVLHFRINETPTVSPLSDPT